MTPQIFTDPVVINVGPATITLLGYTRMSVEHEYENGREWKSGTGDVCVRNNDRVVSSTLTFEVTSKSGQPFLYEVRQNEPISKSPRFGNDHVDPRRKLQVTKTEDQGSPSDSGVLRKGKRNIPGWYHKAAKHG